MRKPPRTKEEARKRRYSAFGSRSFDVIYRDDFCAHSVKRRFHGGILRFSQCSRSPGHGPDKLFCWQHARMINQGDG